MGKRLIFVAAALLTLSACENEIEIIEADNEEMVILNGLLDASSKTHHVHLSVGSGKRVSSLYNAQVKCYVNGKYVSDGKPDQYGLSLSAPYLFEAEIKEGDVVRIETDKGVSAETVVPKAPVVTKVDTLVIAPGNVSEDGEIKFRITFDDIPGEESFYMADIESDFTISFPGDNDFKEEYHDEHFLESDKDPLLDDGASSGDEDSLLNELIELLFGGNEYNVFSDNSFADKSYTIKAKVPYGYLRRDYLTYHPFDWPCEYAFNESVAKFKVFGMDKTTFRYIKSMSSAWTLGSYVITSPVILPTNVEGGIGYVGAMNPGIGEVKFARKRIPITTNDIPYTD